ncbi:MAG TPA: DinB family protein [Ktedonosporobacter sp.]|nr:DinB family protein [Ktedonosporobacter sp.]
MELSEHSYEQIRQKLVTARNNFMGQLAKFEKDELLLQPGENEWSALQVALHLSIVDGLALEEIKRVQWEENPLIVRLDQIAPRMTEEAELPASLDIVLADMAAKREGIFAFLKQLPKEAWERRCRYENWGQLTFAQFIDGLVQHDRLHTEQLAKIYAHVHAEGQGKIG